MERYAWKATVLPGKLEEYIRRHNEIWPEMKDVLHQAGIRNYTIWNVGNELFGYYECDSVAEAARVQAESPVVDRWNEYMKDVMLMEMDPETGAPARAGLASVTVVAEDGLLADGLSTALYIMGLEKASDFWREGRDFEAVFCTEAGTVYVTAGLADRFSGCAFEEIGP